MRTSWNCLGLIVLSAYLLGGCSRDGGDVLDRASFGLASVTGSGTAKIEVNANWGSGYCTQITVTNEGSTPITAWTLKVDVHESTIDNLWSGTYSAEGSSVTIVPMEWNKTIYPNSSAVLGYCASKTGTDYIPEVVSLQVVGSGVSTGTGGAAGMGGAASGGESSTSAGAANGGSDIGGAASGGESSVSGGAATGGAATGGTANGGATTGGSDIGGAASGGESSASGGAANGGTSSLPDGAGGAPASGGTTTAGGSTSTTPEISKTELVITENWIDGYCAKVWVTNLGNANITSWNVTLDVDTASNITVSDAKSMLSGTTLTVLNESYNGLIAPLSAAPNNLASFAFCANKGAETANPVILSTKVVGGTAVPSGDGEGEGIVVKPVLTSDWGSGYCANVTVTNTRATAISDFSVKLDLGDSNIQGIWEATFVQEGSVATLDALPRNGAIAAGSATTLGFCAVTTGPEYHPTVVSVTAVD